MTTPMTPDRWRLVKAAFADLAELPSDERAKRLAEMTFGDAALRAEVEALLAAADSVGDRFERSPLEALAPEVGAEPVGWRVGAYQIIRPIGRGGMGAVYEAHRADADFQKRVALKMVVRGRDSEAILRRFRYERQILARLEHRNIAALLDGGVTDDGQPYFVMEYVEGERIDRYCAALQLCVHDRLRLFRQVCAAVQYAHQNLVVHRDIKPSNILVSADGTVKLLDFGIAKVLDPEGSDAEAMTQTGVAPMTTAYASPEQLAGDPVTTSSDVYSLGVLLYELLTGRPPFNLANLPVLEARRRLAESMPDLPSRVVAAETVSSTSEPTTRRLQRALEGELDDIVMMALRKEPERRYASVETMAEDVLRFLAGLPIQATPDSLRYRVAKLVRRNRGAVAALVVAIVALMAGTVVSLWQAGRARTERDRAQLEWAKAESITEFLRSVFLAATPQQLGREATVVNAIDAALPRVDSAFGDQPAARAAVKNILSSTLFDMGLIERAEPLAREAFRLQADLDSGRVTWAGATTRYNLAMVERMLGHPAAAESLLRTSLAQYESLPDIDPADIAVGWAEMALLLGDQGRHDEAIALQGRVVDLLRQRGGAPLRRRSVSIAKYSSMLTEVGRLAEAEPLHRESVALAEEARGPDDPLVGSILQPYAINLLYAGRPVEAESVARRSYRILSSHFDPFNPATLVGLRGLLNVLVEQGGCAEVVALAEPVVAERGKRVADSELSLGSAYLALGDCLGRDGDPVRAEAMLREAVRLREQTLPAGHWATAHAESLLGEFLARHGKADEGRGLGVRAVAALEAALGNQHYRTLQARSRLMRS
ncbi:MAG: serine/threonine-protein kinase [Gemmatimonadales bacterium]